MDHVKSSMPGMKAAIASLSEEADCIECAASSAESASPMLTSTSKIVNLGCYVIVYTNGCVNCLCLWLLNNLR